MQYTIDHFRFLNFVIICESVFMSNFMQYNFDNSDTKIFDIIAFWFSCHPTKIFKNAISTILGAFVYIFL